MIVDIKECRERKKQMDSDLAFAIERIVKAFHDDTGLSPHTISVSMHDTASIGSAFDGFVIGHIKTEVTI